MSRLEDSLPQTMILKHTLYTHALNHDCCSLGSTEVIYITGLSKTLYAWEILSTLCMH